MAEPQKSNLTVGSTSEGNVVLVFGRSAVKEVESIPGEDSVGIVFSPKDIPWLLASLAAALNYHVNPNDLFSLKQEGKSCGVHQESRNCRQAKN